MPRLLDGRLAEPPVDYDQRQFVQLMRQLEQVLSKNVQTHSDAEDKEALDFFLSN